MATSLIVPASLYRPERPKAYHELVETSSTVFRSSLDHDDRESIFTKTGTERSPALKRAAAVIRSADRILRAGGDVHMNMRKHLEGLALSVARLENLEWTIYDDAQGCRALDHPKGWRKGRWQAAAKLAHRAALSMLLDVPARTWSDAVKLAEISARTIDPLSPDQQRKVAKRLAGYFARILANEAHGFGPKQWVVTIQSDSMAPGYCSGDQIVVERHRGDLMPGKDYIFAYRRLRARNGSPLERLYRFSHVTRKGDWSVERLNNPYDPGRSTLKHCLSPDYWRPAYRVVRLYERKAHH